MGDDLPEASNLVSSDTEVPVSDTCEDEDQDEDEMLRRAIDLSLTNDDATVCEPRPESNLEDYQYSPLPSTDKTIRLLCIPPADHISDPLVCQMHQVRFIDKPQYTALSYTWGAPIFDHHVICNGHRLAITAHLDAALRRFRTKTWLMLWVDALCIDQTNIPERNYQVSIMKHIYSQAFRTFVYLGEACPLDGEVLKLMTSLCELAQVAEQYSLTELKNMKPTDAATSRALDAAIRFIELKKADFPGALTKTTDLLSAGLPHPLHPAWEAMQSLFSRPWFSRMWIIQEVVLSPDVFVMLGGYEMSWELVLKSVFVYKEFGLLGVTRLQNVTVLKEFTKSAATVLATIRLKNDFHSRSLIKLLNSFRHCYSSDPRDKVYALLGLANDQGAHQMVSIDYSKSIDAVYLECAQFFIRNGNGMEMLTIAGIPQKREDTDLKLSLPSWVPDWSGEGPSYIGTWQNGYQAASETQIDMELQDGGNGLNAKGIRIDVIDALAPLLGAHGPEDNDVISWEQKVREVARQSRFFSEERVNGYTKALGLGSCYRCDSTSVDFDASWNGKLTFNAGYFGRVCLAARHLKFCVTRMGYMGWVPKSSQPGDFIIVLYGGRMPLTVRETNGNYVLLGASYLQGLMNGEALKLEHARPEEFVLE